MKDLTKGSPFKAMLTFAVPVALGNMFQLCYSLADTRVVGSTLGEAALAAVGSTTSISTLFVGFLSGLTGGFAILIAREFGAGREDGVRRFGAGSICLALLTSLLLTFLCVGCLPHFLKILHVSEELVPEAYAYIRIILLGLVMTCLYNACAGILRAVGDTAAALAFLILASLLNIALDLFFILNCHMGVAGAALATVLSQMVSVLLSIGYMVKRYPVFRFHIKDFRVTKEDAKALYASGLSMGVMMSLVFFGTLSLQSAINTFGNDVIVAHTAARKVTEFFMLPFAVLGATMATYCGQNMGAGEMGRIRLGIRQALLLSWIWTAGVILISYTAAPQLIYMVTGSRSPQIRETAAWYLKVNSIFYFAPAAISILRNALQGMGEHWVPVVSSFIEMTGKVVIALFLAPVIRYWGIIVAEPIVWILMVIPLIWRMTRCLQKT